jgi:hypothetical protein
MLPQLFSGRSYYQQEEVYCKAAAELVLEGRLPLQEADVKQRVVQYSGAAGTTRVGARDGVGGNGVGRDELDKENIVEDDDEALDGDLLDGNVGGARQRRGGRGKGGASRRGMGRC